ncbi:MAG: hypothetical protein JXA44_05555 [Methanospirillaceae archaeon]|nr:hypothetical protein [Methanospirillaceae archaeon]
MVRDITLICLFLSLILIPVAALAAPATITGGWIPQSGTGLVKDGPALNLTTIYETFFIDEVTETGFLGTRSVMANGKALLIVCNGTFLPDDKGFVLSDTNGGVQYARIEDPDTIMLYILSPFPGTEEESAGADIILVTLKKELPERGINVLVGAMQSAYSTDQEEQAAIDMAGKEGHELYAGSSQNSECDDDGCYCDGEGCVCTGPACYCEGGDCVENDSGYTCNGWDCWLTCNAGDDCSMNS